MTSGYTERMHGVVIKDILWKEDSRSGDILTVLKVYFKEDLIKLTYWNVPLKGVVIIDMLNSSWSMTGIKNGEHVPRFKETANIYEAHIRVHFKTEPTWKGGSWSKLGNEAQQCTDLDKPTMVLSLNDSLDNYHKKHIILHEFGHALGLGHEHQHPEYLEIMEDFCDDVATMDCLGIKKVSSFTEQYKRLNYALLDSDYDVHSIMHYPTKVEMLKKEFQHLKTPEDVDKDTNEYCLDSDPDVPTMLNQKQKQMLKHFLTHVNYVTNEPTKKDKTILARAYYEAYKKTPAYRRTQTSSFSCKFYPSILTTVIAAILIFWFTNQCPVLSDPANGMVAVTGQMFWSTATYTCNSGFELDRNETKTCQLNNIWTGYTPFCVAVVVTITSSSGRQCAGEDYTLTCKFSGEGLMLIPSSYRWLRNGVVQEGDISNTLTFTPLRQTIPSSDGQYTCEVMRNGRSFSSDNFTVSVQAPELRAMITVSGTPVEGHKYSITCSLAGHELLEVTKFHFQWVNNDGWTIYDHYPSYHTSTLHFNGLSHKVDLEEQYRCIITITSPYLSSTSTQEETQNITVISMPTTVSPPVTSSAISKCRTILEVRYKASPMPEKVRWYLPENSRDFIRLTLVKGSARRYPDDMGHILRGNFKQATEERTEISIEQILEGKDGEDKPRYVLIEGAPGIGKSCLAWELCRIWVKGEDPFMKDYRLVILLRLREKEVQKIRNVGELFYFYKKEDKDSLVKEVVDDLGSGILFILDGFDELPKAYQSEGFLLNLIREELSNSTVLVTTRPSATEELLQYENSQPQKRIEVLGFDQKSVEAFALSVFKNETEKLKKFNAYISPKNPVVNSMMYVPLNAAIMVYIFEKNPDSSLPRTLTELYEKLVFTILNKSLMNNGSEKVGKFENLPVKLHEQFLQLLEVAFEGIQNDVVIFYSPPRDFVDLGFLDAVSAFDEEDYTYNFLHLTIQEFFAAYYISNSSNGQEIFKKHGKDKRWNVVWRFVAGLTKFQQYEGHMDEDMFFDRDPKKNGIVTVNLFFIQCFFEAKTMNFTLNVDNLTSLSYAYFSSSALDIYALGYCISNFPTDNMPWILEINSAAIEFLVSGLALKQFKQPVPGAGFIGEFYLSVMPDSDTNLVTFKSGQYFRNLSVLSLAGPGSRYSSRDLIDLTELVPDLHCLQMLDISAEEYFDVDSTEDELHSIILNLIQELSGSSFVSLNIKETGFTMFFKAYYPEYHSAMKALIDPSSGNLEELFVGDHNSDQHDSAGSLMELLSSSSSLKTLHLYNLPPHLLLMNNTRLTKLFISFGVAQSAPEMCAASIAEIIKHNTVLEYLEVKRFSLPTDFNALEVIVNAAIQNNTSLLSVQILMVIDDYDYNYGDEVDYMKANHPELTVDSRIKYN